MMRMNRKHGPPKTLVPKLKKGDDTVTLLTNEQLNLIRFMDRKEVKRLLTTAHTARKVATGKNNPVTKEPIVKFHAVHEYNQYMGAVDRSDQMVSYNAFKLENSQGVEKSFLPSLHTWCTECIYCTKSDNGKETDTPHL